MTITYKQQRTLATRGPVESRPDIEVSGTLLVGTEPALEFDDRHSEPGYDRVWLYPAFADGKQAWLLHRRWIALGHYSASGEFEQVLDFEAAARDLGAAHAAGCPDPGIPDPDQTVAEELAGMSDADRRVAERVADLPDIAPGLLDR